MQKLIQGCIAGDRNSQKELYRSFSGRLFVLCQRYSTNREEAEEILQDGFIQVFKNIQQFENKGSFEGWMRRIFINCALQRFRDNERKIKFSTINEGYNIATESLAYERLLQKELICLIQKLPTAYRLVFNLYVLEGFKHREIAELLNISEGTTKSNLSDARSILKKHLQRKLKINR